MIMIELEWNTAQTEGLVDRDAGKLGKPIVVLIRQSWHQRAVLSQLFFILDLLKKHYKSQGAQYKSARTRSD